MRFNTDFKMNITRKETEVPAQKEHLDPTSIIRDKDVAYGSTPIKT